MRLEHYSQKKLEKEILEIVGKYLDLKKYKVFFFGSRANGESHKRSDIDVGIEGAEKFDESIIYKIKGDIEELNILYKIDIVNFTNASEKFLEVVGNNKEYIN